MHGYKEHKSNAVIAGRLQHIVRRLREQVRRDDNKYSGNERNYTFHGGFTSGYNRGRLVAFENIADSFGIDIDE